MDLLTKILPLPCSADLRQNPVLFHDSQHSFRIVVDSLVLQPQVHSTIAVCLVASILMLFDLPSQNCILIRSSHSAYIGVVAASGHAKELTHN